MSSFLGGGGGGSGTTVATGNIDLYVATTGSDSNPGTLASPFATIQHAANVATTFDYVNQFFPTIHIAAGTYPYTANSINLNVLLRSVNPGLINGAGFATTIANDVNGNNGFTALRGASWVVQNITVKTDAFAFASVAGSALLQVYDCGMDEETPAAGGPAAAIFANDEGIIFLGNTFHVACNEFDALAQIYTGSFGFVFSSTTLTLQATTAIHHNKAFLMCTDQSEVSYTPGSVVNGGGVGGTGFQLLLQTGSVCITNNGLITDIPGVNGVLASDASAVVISNNTGSGQFFNNSQSGLPTTSQISPGFFGIWKDSSANAGAYIAYNDAGVIKETAVGPLTPNTQTASYVLALTDVGRRVEMNVGIANNLTVPANATVAFIIGTEIAITQIGTGTTTVVAAGGVTVDNIGSLAGQWASAKLYKRGTNEWVMTLV